MLSIRSPLGALGVVMVLVEGISVGALAAVRSNFVLQATLVSVISVVTFAIAALVIWIVKHFAKTNPALLFNPQDISLDVHKYIFPPPGSVSLEIAEDKPSQPR